MTGPEQVGPGPLAGYLMRDHAEVIAALGAARDARRLSLATVGRRSGHTLQRISLWLRGDQVPRADGLFDLAHALGYDLALIPRKDTP